MCVAVGAPGASAALMSTHMIHDEAWSAARSERAHGFAPKAVVRSQLSVRVSELAITQRKTRGKVRYRRP